jgi:hypothetical protein
MAQEVEGNNLHFNLSWWLYNIALFLLNCTVLSLYTGTVPVSTALLYNHSKH